MSYIQLIEIESPNYQELMKLHEQWLADTEGERRFCANGSARTGTDLARMS